MANKSIRFKVGMTVIINSDKTGCGRTELVASHGYKKGDKVTLDKYDSADETWRVKKKDTSTIWIKRKNLAPISKPSIWKIGDQFTVPSAREAIVYTIKENISYFTKVDICWKRSDGTAHSLSYFKSGVDSLFEGGSWKLVPPTPVVNTPPPPFKIGDKVVLINKDAEWAQSDRVTTGKEYTVKQCSQTSKLNPGYIKVTGNGAIGTMWIATKDFKLAPVVETPLFKVGDKVQYVPNPNSQYSESDYYAQRDGLIPGNIYTVSKSFIAKLCDYGDIQWVHIKEGSCKFNIAADCFATEPKKTMRAVCINPGHDYRTRLTEGQTYDVQEAETIGDDKFFKVLNPNDGSPFITCWQRRFVVITETPPPAAPKKRMAVCVDMSNSTADYKLGETYEITDEDNDCFSFKNKGGGMFKWRFKEIMDEQTPVPTEATNNPFKVGDRVRLTRLKSVIYDKDYFMKHDNLTIGGEYEVTELSNNGSYPDKTFILLKGKSYCHPYDCFELAAPTSKYTIEVVCNENDGYERFLTIGKTYMAKLNPKNTAEEPEKDLYDIETSDRGDVVTTAYCRRFTVVPKVGHTLTAEWLNNSTPKDFYGFTTDDRSRNKWETMTYHAFNGDRKIERIEVVGGRLAALISGTCNIWIAVESIMRNSVPSPMPDIAGVEFKDRAAFISELTALIAKHKK
jgi:hypothetical protein